MKPGDLRDGRVVQRAVLAIAVFSFVLTLGLFSGANAAPGGPTAAPSAQPAKGKQAAQRKRAAKTKRTAKAKKRARPCRATKRGPVLRSPGYRGACRTPRTKPNKPPPPVRLSGLGRHPDLVVDAAGTAHIVWNEDGGETEDKLRYCRLKRGSKNCDNPSSTQSLYPVQPYTPAAGPRYNVDTAGPAVAAVGSDLALITYRYPIVTQKPDGASSDSTYMWVSDNGGQSMTGPALVGNLEPSGGVTAFGPADAPRIGMISDTKSGGTYFQSIVPGAYNGARANLGAGGPDRANSGRLTTLDGRPLAAFSDLSGQTFVRQWNGSGSIEEAASFSCRATPPG